MSFFQKFRIYSLSNNTIIIRSLVAHLLRRQSCKQKVRVRSRVGVFCTFSQKHYYFLFFLFKMTIQFFLLSQFYSTFQREKDFRINLKATIFYGVRKSRPFLPCCVAAEKSARLLNPEVIVALKVVLMSLSLQMLLNTSCSHNLSLES